MVRILAISLIALMLLPTRSVQAARAADLSKRSDDWFGSTEGRETLDCILSWQTEHGDWPKNTDTTKPYTGKRSELLGTFDNGATTGELRALARAFKKTGDQRYEKAFLKGFDHILKAQYSNGGWPQYYPLRKGYYNHITFNDNCMIRLMEFLRDLSRVEDYPFLDKGRRESAIKAIERGVDCIVKCQVVLKGTPTTWCAQHDEVTLAPAKARSYELPSLSGSESAGILRFLMSIDHPSPEVIRAVKAGVAWFDTAKIKGIRVESVKGDRQVIEDPTAPPVWARFYELETGRPMFCDRDGVIKYALKDIGHERRNGYAWYGNWGQGVAEQYAKWPHR